MQPKSTYPREPRIFLIPYQKAVYISFVALVVVLLVSLMTRAYFILVNVCIPLPLRIAVRSYIDRYYFGDRTSVYRIFLSDKPYLTLPICECHQAQSNQGICMTL